MSRHVATSHWPSAPRPTALTVPSSSNPRVLRQPAATAMTPRQASTSHCPSSFQPVATMEPSERRPIVWERPVLLAECTLPAATAMTSFHDPTWHSRAALLPTASTVPSPRRPTECRLPAASAGASGRTLRLRLGDQFESRPKSGDSVGHQRLPRGRERAAADDGLTLSKERGQFDFSALEISDVHATHHRLRPSWTRNRIGKRARAMLRCPTHIRELQNVGYARPPGVSRESRAASLSCISTSRPRVLAAGPTLRACTCIRTGVRSTQHADPPRTRLRRRGLPGSGQSPIEPVLVLAGCRSALGWRPGNGPARLTATTPGSGGCP